MSIFDWRAIGIEVRGGSGNVKTTCPNCSADRRHSREKCLSANLSNGTFRCHHCEWAGRAPVIGEFKPMQQPKRKIYRKPEYHPGADPQDSLIAWFQRRGISEAVVRRNRCEARSITIDGASVRAIAFPYLRDGEIVNVQYRTADKQFRLEAGAELLLYGWDDIQPGEPLIWVEGQIDKLSLEEAGYVNCVSVPNGANLGDGEWLAAAQDRLATVSHFILAGDNDERGRALTDELTRRLGPERCWRVEWPEGCKDANDVLVRHGRAALIEAIECAQPLPISGIVRLTDLMPDLEQLYREGVRRGEHPGWDSLAEYYRPRAGEWTMVTGAPGMGKSAVLDALLMNLAIGSDWRFAVYSPEMLPLQRHVAALLELWGGQPFNAGMRSRLDWNSVREGVAHLSDYFTFIHSEEESPSVDRVLELARACVMRFGIRGLVIDPWNELEHARPAQMSETEHISQSLSKIRRFARTYDVHVWVMVHPTKLQKQQDGSYPVASPYDASGSAHWFNKADMILSIWRDKTRADAAVEIHVQKVRFRENGGLGKAELYYDRVTGRLSEDPPFATRYEEREEVESGRH